MVGSFFLRFEGEREHANKTGRKSEILTLSFSFFPPLFVRAPNSKKKTFQGVKVSVLNDFEAAGYGVLDLRPGDGDVLPLNDVPADPRGPIAVLGPGTGLGQAQLFWDSDEGHYRVWPSEGAHGGFAPRGWRQRALSGSVEDALGYCEVKE